MPVLNDRTMDQVNLSSGHYGYSGTRIDDLGATEYTLATIVADISGSTEAFLREMEFALQEIVKSLKYSPRADNLMVRLVVFDTRMQEIHGFKLLSACNVNDYRGILRSGGATALFDSAHNAIEAEIDYGKQLLAGGFSANGIVYVITDGDDNSSKLSAKAVKRSRDAAVQSEALESLLTILIGVNVQDPAMSRYLADFKVEGGFDQYVELSDASADTLVKLADFISRSISAQSMSLGTGGPSQTLTF